MNLNNCRSSRGEEMRFTGVDNNDNICNVNSSNGKTITTQKSFLSGQVTAQFVTVRDSQEHVETTHILGGKIRP
jgi:hypothetical protein